MKGRNVRFSVADEARAQRVREWCEARKDAKLEVLRSVAADLATAEDIEAARDLVRDRIFRLEGGQP